ncbi:MAG: hypothetical protein ACKVG0_09265, partial [Alphaproteobacteria bacterium]
IESLWNEWGNKPINEGSGHFWKPGLGKWRQYFSKVHMRILRNAGFGRTLEQLGYDPSVLFEVDDLPDEPSKDTLPDSHFLIVDFHMQRFHGKQPVFNISRFKADLHQFDRCTHAGFPYMRVYASPSMAETLQSNSEFPVLCQVLTSM